MAKATSGWIPTMTVSAPRRRIMCAISRSVREANESITSIAVTSTMTPRERCFTTCCTRLRRSWLRSASETAAWKGAISTAPCLRMGTSTWPFLPIPLAWFSQRHHLVPQQSFGLLDAPLQVAHRVHLPEVDTDGHQRLGNLWREARDDNRSAQQPGSLDGLHQVVRYRDVHSRHTGDIDYDHLRSVCPDASHELFR